MSDIATSLNAALMRIVDSVIDDVAVDGIAALKKVLDDSGFSKSSYLKDYEIYAHVDGRTIVFEILIPADALNMDDSKTADAVTKAAEQDPDAHTPGVRTYGFQPTTQPGRLTGRRDARRDARQPARDARRDARKAPQTLESKAKTAQSRLIEHQIALNSPRGATVDRQGKISLRMSKSVEDKPDGGVQMPQGQFQGVIGKFMKELEAVIRDNFAPELEKVLERRLS